MIIALMHFLKKLCQVLRSSGSIQEYRFSLFTLQAIFVNLLFPAAFIVSHFAVFGIESSA